MLDRRQDVVELAVLGRRVVDGVRDDDRQAQVGRQGRRLGDEPVVVGEQVVRQLDVEAVLAEDPGKAFRRRPCAAPIADEQPPADLAARAA